MNRLTIFWFLITVVSIASAQTGYGHTLTAAVFDVTSAFLLPLQLQSVLQSGSHNDCDLVQPAIYILLLLQLWILGVVKLYRVIFDYTNTYYVFDIYTYYTPYRSRIYYRPQYRSVTTYTSTFGCCSGYYQSWLTCRRKCYLIIITITVSYF